MKEYYDDYWSQAIPPPQSEPEGLSLARRRFLWSMLPAGRRQPIRLLEVGSGEGTLVAEVAGRGLDAAGMEISRVAIQRARALYPSCTFIEHSLEDRPWPVPAQSYDVVVSFEVIEHLLRPRQLLAGAYEVLKPGGYLALTTPFHGRFKNVVLGLVGFDRHFNVEGEHIRFFTDGSLIRLLLESGFRVERIAHFGRFWGLWAGVFVWALRR